ncbi:MAG: host factor-I protein [Acidobacteriota bacterium]|nr:host factor-I protein [Acidobacteriota bacterium]
MDSKSAPQNIQDAFLNTARRERSNVTVYLVSGTKLQGRIKSFDKFSVLLESGTQEQLIFKHAISTIQHARRSSGELRGGGPPDAVHPDGSASATTDGSDRTEA